MSAYEGVNISGEVAGFDYSIVDAVRDHSVKTADSAITFNRTLYMADEADKRTNTPRGTNVATLQVPFKADSPDALEAALEASRQMPAEQTLRNTVLLAEASLNTEENAEVLNRRRKLRGQVAALATGAVIGGGALGVGVTGGIEAISQHSKTWGEVSITGIAIAGAALYNTAPLFRKALNVVDVTRENLRRIHRRQDMVELAKKATEPVK